MRWKLMVLIGLGILIAGAITMGIYTNKNKTSENNLCSWSKYSKSFEENGFLYCCKYQVNNEGDYGLNPDGTQTLNQCEAREK